MKKSSSYDADTDHRHALVDLAPDRATAHAFDQCERDMPAVQRQAAATG